MKELDAQGVSCPVCGSEALKGYEADASDCQNGSRVNIMECCSCVFAWQFPVQRTRQESVEFFQASYTDNAIKARYFDPEHKRKIASLELEFLNTLPVQGNALLDIGAGAGIFARTAAEQWRVTAVDPAIDPEAFASDAGLMAIKGELADVPPGQSFDVVTLWDVIEHVETPCGLIEAAYQLLNPGGWLVLETGNFKSAERVRQGLQHWIYQLDHKWYFSPESLEGLLQDAGFMDVRHCDAMLRPGWQGSANYAGPSRSYLLRDLLSSPAQAAAHLARHRELKRAISWPRSGIGIFAVAGQRPE